MIFISVQETALNKLVLLKSLQKKMSIHQQAIAQTKKWIQDVVIGCNFCPFAATAIKKNELHYTVENSMSDTVCTNAILTELIRLDEHSNIETSFLIFSNAYTNFNEFLNLIRKAEMLLKRKNYEGIYQIASFHPAYLFDKSLETDAANYTNRSPYPMLHFLREKSIRAATKNFEGIEQVPATNIDFARNKGLAYMKLLRDNCF